MSIKQTIEDHIALFFLGTLAIGFASGWGAFSAIQIATGHTSISIDRLKQLEGPEALEKKALQAKLEELELERASLLQHLATNRQTSGNYVRNITITPKTPAVLPVGTGINVKFDYVLTKGEKAHIWAIADGPTLYDGAAPVSGSGTEGRKITGQRAGKVREVTIRMGSHDGETLYEMKLPVEFTFK